MERRDILRESWGLREYQNSLVDYIISKLQGHEGVAVEAPTGSGKTITGLCAAVEFASSTKKKVLYLTRTNSQQEQVLKELRKINQNEMIKAVPLQGRHNLCPLYMEMEEGSDFSSDSLSRFCNSKKKRVREGDGDACRFYNQKVQAKSTQDVIFSEIPDAEKFLEYGITNTVCPYESLKVAASNADLVVAPYSYFLNNFIADRFLSRWGVAREDLVVVMDEAHNLPDLARELSSYEITMKNIELAEKESQEFGDSELSERFRATDYCEMLRNAILDLMEEHLEKRDEARIQFRDLVEYAAIGAKISMEDFWSYTSIFALFGEMITQKKDDMGKVPRSHVLSLSGKMLTWRESEDESFVAIVSNDDDGKVEAFCMEPRGILEPLRKSKTIHMSGTLEPFKIYREITGFSDLPARKMTNIFPEENRQILYFDDISTKYDEFTPEQALKLRDLISSIIEKVGRKTVVFFTSYNVMDRIIQIGFSFPFMAESRNTSQQDLMNLLGRFRKGDAPLLAVMGGRISEGINLPGEQLEVVVIAGIPYPRPDAKHKALFAYYESVHRNGWEYAVTFPVLVKMRQAIGRLIRSADDIGSAIILDRRASYFRPYIPEMMLSHDPVGDAEKFFEMRKNKEVG